MAVALAMLFVYQLLLQQSNDFINGLEKFAKKKDWQINAKKYVKKRNKLFTTNLFLLLLLYIIFVNYGLDYKQIDFLLPARAILPMLAVFILVNFLTSGFMLRSSSKTIFTGLNDEVYDVEPQLNECFWKWKMVYFNKSDSRVFVCRRSGIGWTTNHARILPAILLYSGTILILLVMIMLF